MMPKFLPLLDRAVDSMPTPDPSGANAESAAVAGGEGIDGTRPRSAFAELMSASDAAGTTERSVTPGSVPSPVAGSAAKAGDKPGPSPEVPEPFAPSFDLPAFLQVLPRSGSEVAVAAAREPGLSAAVRRLATATAVSEARSVDAPDVAIRLPSFLIPPKVDPPVAQPVEAAGTAAEPARAPVTTAALAGMAAAQTTAGVSDVGAVPLAANTPVAPPASAAPRTATAALESALRRGSAEVVRRDNAAAPSATAPSASALVGPVSTDPLAQAAMQSSPSAPMPSLAVQATRPKAAQQLSSSGRKESGPRVAPGNGGLRASVGLEPSALVGMLQRPFESATARTETPDRGSVGGKVAQGGPEGGASTTMTGLGSPADAAPLSSLPSIDQGERQSQASVLLRLPVGSEAWQDELSAQLSFMAEQGEGTEAVMKLAPEELGELEVRVEVRDGEAALQFGVANAEARLAVEAAQAKLRDLFSSQGMNISEFKVFSNLNGNSQPNSNDNRGSRPTMRLAAGADADLEVVARPRRSVGVVDLYA